jgi:hypothetical protein
MLKTPLYPGQKSSILAFEDEHFRIVIGQDAANLLLG